MVLATHTAGVSVDGYTLTLAANSVEHRAHLQLDARPRAALRLPLPARHGLQLRGVHVHEADNVYDPLYGSFVGDQGAWSTAKMYFTVPPHGVAKLHFGAHFPNQTANSEKCVFRVLRLLCCLGLQIRSFSAENLLQVFAVLRNPYSASKNLRIPAR